MLPIIFLLLYTTGFVGSTSNYGLTELSCFHHTINGSDHGGGLKLDSDSLAGHTNIRCQGIETPLPSANLEPETSDTEVIYTNICIYIHTNACMHECTNTHTHHTHCTTGTGAKQFIY
jgi:hypothetical protein